MGHEPMTSRSEPDPGRAVPAHGSEPVARWERRGAVAGIVAAVLFFADLATLSPSPTVGTSEQRVAEYLQQNGALTLAMSYLGAVTAVVLLPFIASLRTFVRSHATEVQWRWTITLLAGAVAVAVILVGSAMRGAAALLAHDDGAAAVSALFHAAKVCLSFALVPLAVMVAANGRTTPGTNVAVRWPIQAAPWIGGLGLLSAALIFVNNDWLGPGEPIVAVVALINAMWVAAAAIAILQGEKPLVANP